MVQLVDFGGIRSVSHVDVRRLLPRFLHLPIQAVECYLVGLEPVPPTPPTPPADDDRQDDGVEEDQGEPCAPWPQEARRR